MFYFHKSRWINKDTAVIYLSVLHLFSSSFMVCGLTCRPLIHFEFLCMLLESSLLSCSYTEPSSFPSPILEETAFSPVYILASFATD